MSKIQVSGPPPAPLPLRAAFRWTVAVVLLLCHLIAVAAFARERFSLPIVSEPSSPPSYSDPFNQHGADHARRLVYARWDSGQYISIALRGYSQCPKGQKLSIRQLDEIHLRCNLDFYPGYGLMGMALMAATRLPADYALWAIALVSSLLFLFLWTDPAIQKALGTKETYLALLLFNVYPGACHLVFVLTEPCLLFFTIACFVAVLRKHYWLGALAAGAASAMRISGVATSAAFGAALLVEMWHERDRGTGFLVRHSLMFPVAGWGVGTLMAFHFYRFGDALAYLHAHAAAWKQNDTLGVSLLPTTDQVMHSMDFRLHGLVWMFGLVLWFLIGHRTAMRRLRAEGQAFCYVLTCIALLLAYSGSLHFYMEGFNRQAIVAFPVFFAMSTFLLSRPAVLAVWIIANTWNYVESDVCYYLADAGGAGFGKCNGTQWIGSGR